MIDRLLSLCRENGYSFELEYSECEDNFTLNVHGAGFGEYFYARKIKHLNDAIDYVSVDIAKFLATANPKSMTREKMKTPELHDQDKFFTLPIADDFGCYLQPVESSDQPMGFKAANGEWWIGVWTEQGLMRQRWDGQQIHQIGQGVAVRISEDAVIEVDIVGK